MSAPPSIEQLSKEMLRGQAHDTQHVSSDQESVQSWQAYQPSEHAFAGAMRGCDGPEAITMTDNEREAESPSPLDQAMPVKNTGQATPAPEPAFEQGDHVIWRQPGASQVPVEVKLCEVHVQESSVYYKVETVASPHTAHGALEEELAPVSSDRYATPPSPDSALGVHSGAMPGGKPDRRAAGRGGRSGGRGRGQQGRKDKKAEKTKKAERPKTKTPKRPAAGAHEDDNAGDAVEAKHAKTPKRSASGARSPAATRLRNHKLHCMASPPFSKYASRSSAGKSAYDRHLCKYPGDIQGARDMDRVARGQWTECHVNRTCSQDDEGNRKAELVEERLNPRSRFFRGRARQLLAETPGRNLKDIMSQLQREWQEHVQAEKDLEAVRNEAAEALAWATCPSLNPGVSSFFFLVVTSAAVMCNLSTIL